MIKEHYARAGRADAAGRRAATARRRGRSSCYTVAARRGHARAGRVRRLRARLRRRGARARRGLRVVRARALRADDWSASRRCGSSTTRSSTSRCSSSRWRSTRSSDGRAASRAGTADEARRAAASTRELAPKNLVWGWALFGLFCALFGGHGADRARLPLARLAVAARRRPPAGRRAAQSRVRAARRIGSRVSGDLAFRARTGGRRRRDHDGALPRVGPARRDETGPDAGLGGRPRGRGGDPRRTSRRPGAVRASSARSSATTAGDAQVDRRPDRRDDELRARRAGVGDAARARARGRGRGRRSSRRPRSHRRWWAVRGEGAFARRRAAAGSRRWRGSRTRRVSTTLRAQDAAPAGATIVARAWSNRGLGDFWQHCLVAEGALDVGCDSIVAGVGLRRQSGSSSRKRAAGARRTRAASRAAARAS